MSGGTQPQMLVYYREMHDRIDAAKARIDAELTDAGDVVLEAARQKIRAAMAERYCRLSTPDGPDPHFESAQETTGEMAHFLLDVEHGQYPQAADAAETAMRDFGFEDPALIRVARQMADDLFDLVVTMERDHYDEYLASLIAERPGRRRTPFFMD